MVRNADVPPARMYRDYLRRLPARSYEGACSFQGQLGCALPRRMRAHICNSWECDDLGSLRRQLNDPNDGPPPTVVVPIDDEGVGRPRLIEDA